MFFKGYYQRTVNFNKNRKGSPLSKPLISFPLTKLQPGGACLESCHVEAEAGGPPESNKTTERQEVITQSNTEPPSLFSFQVSGQKIQNEVYNTKKI